MRGFGFGPVRAGRRRLQGGSVATTLPSAANIVARWSADAILPQADNSALASWTDSVNGLVAAEASNRPKYRTNLFNGRPGIEFTAANGHQLVLPRASAAAINTAMANQQYAVMIVARSKSNSAGSGFVFSTGGGDAPVLSLMFDGSEIGRQFSAGSKILYAAQTLTTLGYTGTNVPINPQTGGMERVFVNGSCVATQIAYPPSGGSGNYGFGSDGARGYFFDGFLFDVVVWNKELTQLDWLQAEKWVREKYGQAYPWASVATFDVFHGDSITQGLGADRPYYSYPTYAAATLGKTLGQWTNLGIGGQTIAECDARAALEVDGIAAITGKPTRLAFIEFFNSANRGGLTGAQCAAATATYLANRRGAGIGKIALGTCTGSGGSGQANAVQAKKAAFVAGLLGLSPSLYDALVRVDQNASVGVDGAYANTTDYFNADGVHLYGKAVTPNGYNVLAGLMATGMAGL